MVKKKSSTGFEHKGIAPNILLKHVENTAPFLFAGEVDSSAKDRDYLEKLRFYKKNLKLLKNLDLHGYFHLCLCAHWATAGTFVPTDVDNQIREGLWNHGTIGKHIDRMVKTTIESWKWDYSPMTNRVSYNSTPMSTHEGTWLSVAIGAYCATKKQKRADLAQMLEDVILEEVKKEEEILLHLVETQDHLNFLRAAPLMAHNFGDLDRVIIQWNMDLEDPFIKRIYKLGHNLNPNYSEVLVYTGKVNKAFSSKENHRHMALRVPKCLRRSNKFLIPVGPFMDDWGEDLIKANILTLTEVGEVVAALYDGFLRQVEAFGYIRGFRGILNQLENGLADLESALPFDLIRDIKKSEFYRLSEVSRETFEADYKAELEKFRTPDVNFQFS
ncbi:MAG: hypothetical protein K9K67_03640 [Bacteriovoracaceae bacterium]|nr:hypothetical protein [Bacteriovoracaceae bacterium]